MHQLRSIEQPCGSTPVVAEVIGANLLGPIEDYLPDQSWDRTLFFRVSVDY